MRRFVSLALRVAVAVVPEFWVGQQLIVLVRWHSEEIGARSREGSLLFKVNET